MAVIHLYKFDDDNNCTHTITEEYEFAWQCVVAVAGDNHFEVYDGDLCRNNEVSRDETKMQTLTDASVLILPGASVAVAAIVAVVVAVAVVLLTPKPKPLDNVNRQQESPNNSLSDRNNKARPNQRIVDICGQVKSIPDIIQPEWSKYVDDQEIRTGAYCVARKQVQIEEVKDGDTLFTDAGQSAGIYYPFKSPNNSTPDVQIGDVIDEPVVGVFESSDAIDQTLLAPNEAIFNFLPEYSIQVRSGDFVDLFTTGGTGPFAAGDEVELVDFYWEDEDGVNHQVGTNTNTVHEVFGTTIRLVRSSDPSWDVIPTGLITTLNTTAFSPYIVREGVIITVGPFNISSIKIDRIVANVYALNGLFKEDKDGKQRANVQWKLSYQKLNDDLEPVGPLTTVFSTISGADARTKGDTIDIDLGARTFVKWSVERVTDKDFGFDGNVSDEIKVKSVFGLYSVDRDHFGDITMIQTQRKSIAQTVLIKSPEVNCIATEMINKYEAGVFAPTLTPNTQAMQSLIRIALDDRIGRRTVSELDLPLLESVQNEIEAYFNADAGSFNYSFDSTNTTAQETLFTIANAAFVTLWREGRVLKGWFERPQNIPEMVFTHRSKVPSSETWTRNRDKSKRKDGVEFIYTDDKLYTQETLYIPADRSAKNPEKIEIPGIKGLSQATWRANREFNKLKYAEIDVDFTATAEGRFVKPNRMISVVKGTRVASYDGDVFDQDGFVLTLSQEVVFTPGDNHFILLKKRDGSLESIPCFDVGHPRKVQLGFLPAEAIYTGNSEKKTEFSFASESREKGQWVLPQTIDPSDKNQVNITGINYSDLYYKDDPVVPVKGAFSDGWSDGFDIQS